MSFEIRLTVTAAATSLAVIGALEGAASQVFQGSAQAALALDQSCITLDLLGLDSMDHAAAGMLILFDAAAKARGKSVVITNAGQTVLEALDRSHLGKLMPIL